MRTIFSLCATLLIASCVPDFEADGGALAEPRILAVRGVPAEARPGDVVRYEALLADPSGQSRVATFSYCSRPRNAEERTGVSQACLRGEGLVQMGAETAIPSDACALFGPNTPPVGEGEPARRPSDPDPSGGYFLPIRAEDESDAARPSFGFQRIRCDLAGATRDIFEAYQARYQENLHPDIVRVVATGAGELQQGQSMVISNRQTELRLEISSDSFEPYVVYSAIDSALYDATETLRVHWYASAGQFDASATPIDRTALSAAVLFTPPEDFSEAQIWMVVIDSRGGSAWRNFVLTDSP